jgi:peptidoglycan/xylan/chitin deacetylase (PgdA/CDA1 family)
LPARAAGYRDDMTSLTLTFDDGPDERGTPAVLEALRAERATATFFVGGPEAERHPDLLAQIVEDGHGIGLHCDAHIRHSELDRAGVLRDTERALGRLDALRVAPTLWRTPWGVTEPFTREIADRFGLRIIGWDLDTHDWRGDSAETMLAATRHGLRAGSIVLLHDGIGPGARREDCRQTAVYVRLAAQWAARQGLGLCAL